MTDPRVEALATALAETIHDAMCDVSHHDPPPARCSRWAKYPQIALFVAPRLLAALPPDRCGHEAEIARLRAAEVVCLMVGWSAAARGERGKALHELWVEWSRAYELSGGSLIPADHPELSDRRIRELAAQRDAKVTRTRAALAGGSE